MRQLRSPALENRNLLSIEKPGRRYGIAGRDIVHVRELSAAWIQF